MLRPSDSLTNGWFCQHYGYAFSYETLTLQSAAPRFINIIACDVRIRALLLPCRSYSLPPEVAATARGLEQFKNSRKSKTSAEEIGYFTQLTLNEYIPGQGISSHIGNSAPVSTPAVVNNCVMHNQTMWSASGTASIYCPWGRE